MITFQKLIFKLYKYWSSLDCTIIQPYDIEIGAATFHPITFFNSLNKKNIFFAYVQLCRRPIDSNFGTYLSMKLQQYYQFQVILRSSLKNIRKLYIDSLKYLNINLNKNELKFIEDNWENSTLGAYGVGWEVWLNGIEITQFTYFQQMAGFNCNPVIVEITYGLERLSLLLQNVTSIYNLFWNKNIKYNEVVNIKDINILRSIFNYYKYNNIFLFNCMNNYKKESLRLINLKNPLLMIAYDYALKVVHYFNLLNSSNYFSSIEKKKNILSIRNLFCEIANIYIKNNK